MTAEPTADSIADSVARRSTVPPRMVTWLAAAAFAVLLVAMIGGYAYGWEWTGFGQHVQLWDVLHLLVLPVVVAALPIWYRTRTEFGTAWIAGIALLAVVFVALIVGGYFLAWGWTGFQGNTLWDWLELLVLPIAVGALPFWLETNESAMRQWRLLFVGAGVALTVLAVGGYWLDWEWTGFPGNTLWDWLNLLLVPFLLPAAVTLYLKTTRD